MGNSLWIVTKNSLKIKKLLIKFVRNYKIIKSLECNLGSFLCTYFTKDGIKKGFRKGLKNIKWKEW